MGEYVDTWANQGKTNVHNNQVTVSMMQSEAGAAGALHGAVTQGALSTTFTASQGLLLMIPNMYLLSGELMPTVFHVAARTISKQGLSIYNDHSDVMAVRQTGYAMLCSSNVQEVMDLALVSHIATINSRVPFIHFFDGWRTSSQVEKIHRIPKEDIAKIFPSPEIIDKNLRTHALNPNNPFSRGVGYRPDIFFQASYASKPYFDKAPEHIIDAMQKVESITGRHYRPYMYHGAKDAEVLVVLMGSAALTVETVVDYLNKRGQKTGVLNVHMFRPWSAKHFLSEIPKTIKRVAILDKTNEEGSQGNPLFLDVMSTFTESNLFKIEAFAGGVYGISSKEFLPNMAKAVFDNISLPIDQIKRRFVVGITDDLTQTHLEIGPPLNTVHQNTSQCLFYGLGKDGTVGANKQAIKSIGEQTDMTVQGYFVYSAHKGDGLTISHLRFGTEQIKDQFEISNDANYIAIHSKNYVYSLYEQFMAPIKEGGTLLLNVPWLTLKEINENLPSGLKNLIAQKKVQFYVIDAGGIAKNVGLRQRINNIMQACFYKLSGVLPFEQAMQVLKHDIDKVYASKGPKVLKMNKDAVDMAINQVTRIEYPADWIDSKEGKVLQKLDQSLDIPEWNKKIQQKMAQELGSDLPVSVFTPGGIHPNQTTIYEKRGFARMIPQWKPELCTQCNYCSLQCPHGVIRPFLLNKQEVKNAPDNLKTLKAIGSPNAYSIIISSYDCTGCEVCVETCPEDALFMENSQNILEQKMPQVWEYAISKVTEKPNPNERTSVKGSQFEKPLLEFSGACAGCGETPYVKLITQLFGERMTIANTSGCSSVWGGIAGSSPFAKNSIGQGPAWGRSLFEDTSEYGYGMTLATKARRNFLLNDVNLVLEKGIQISQQLKNVFQQWVKQFQKSEICSELFPQLKTLLALEKSTDPILKRIKDNANMFTVQSQ